MDEKLELKLVQGIDTKEIEKEVQENKNITEETVEKSLSYASLSRRRTKGNR